MKAHGNKMKKKEHSEKISAKDSKKAQVSLYELLRNIIVIVLLIAIVVPLTIFILNKGKTSSCGVDAINNFDDIINNDKITFSSYLDYKNELGNCLPKYNKVTITNDEILVNGWTKVEFENSFDSNNINNNANDVNNIGNDRVNNGGNANNWLSIFEFLLERKEMCDQQRRLFSLDLSRMRIMQNGEENKIFGVHICDQVTWDSTLLSYDLSQIPEVSENEELLKFIEPIKDSDLSSTRDYFIGFIYEDKNELSSDDIVIFERFNVNQNLGETRGLGEVSPADSQERIRQISGNEYIRQLNDENKFILILNGEKE